VRSQVADARLRTVTIPGKHQNAVFTADDLAGVKPINAATSVCGLKHSREPILAAGKVRFVGEIVAACVGRSRAETEDVAASVQLEFEEKSVPRVSACCRWRDAASLLGGMTACVI
jgi:carbon-monoxide dehydrogenase large subunit